jgi:hypothetical protein
MPRSLPLLIVLLAPGACGARAEPSLESSARAAVWTSDRLNRDEGVVATADLWVRAAADLAEPLSVRLEGWLGIDPVGEGDPGSDLREGLLILKHEAVTLRTGRQIFSWGRADRINPTDVISPRDQRRLVEDEEDNRRGLAAVSLDIALGGGTLSAHWLPEFRPSELPQTLMLNTVSAVRLAPDGPERQFALRFERFGTRIDWSVTYSEAADRTPWLGLEPGPGGPALTLRHPRLRMLGFDAATVLGNYGVRLEVAGYRHERSTLSVATERLPRFAAVLGVDRSFPGQWSMIAQAILRVSADGVDRAGALAARNAVIHGAWQSVIGGGFVHVRKGFAGDRGSAEVVGAGLTGGGAYGQLKASYALRDGLRVHLLAERYGGGASSFLGRLRDNSLVSVGLRAGF